jgi:hypothetical protein
MMIGSTLFLLARFAGVNSLRDKLPALVSTLTRSTQADIRERAQADRFALAVDGVIEAPPMRSALDEQQQVQAVTIAQAFSLVVRFDFADTEVRRYEISGHCSNFVAGLLGSPRLPQKLLPNGGACVRRAALICAGLADPPEGDLA